MQSAGGHRQTRSSPLCSPFLFCSHVRAASHCYRLAVRRVEKSLQHSYNGRKQKKRAYRSLWISRINAAVRAEDMSYSRFVNACEHTGVEINRKILAQLAIYEPFSFGAVVSSVRNEAEVPRKVAPRYGLLQTAVTSHTRPSAQPVVHAAWNQTPSIAKNYFERQKRRLEHVAGNAAREAEEAEMAAETQ